LEEANLGPPPIFFFYSMGALVLGPPVNQGYSLYFFIAGLFIIVIGCIYIVLQFVAAIDRPRPVYIQEPLPSGKV